MSTPRRRRPPPSRRRARSAGRRNSRSDLRARIYVALPAILVVVLLVDFGGIVFALALAILGCICIDELFGLFERAHPIRLAGFIGVVGLVLAAQYGSQFQLVLVFVALLPVMFGLTLIAPRGGVPGMTVTLFGVAWIGFALAHAVLLRNLPHGEGVVIDVLVGTFVGDTGAYLGGRMFGRRPLAPRISPNKTLEGLAIGMFLAVASVWFASLYQDWMHKGNALLLGLAVALAAPIGDLFESYVKRESGAKDTGTLFGAHGGALDRIDAVMFSAVIGYYVWNAMA